MADTTTIQSLPLIQPSQAQKHVTHNEALKRIDVMIQLAVLDRDLTAPPGSPVLGEAHIVAAGASGGWAGHDAEVAVWNGFWEFYPPVTGWAAWVAGAGEMAVFDGAAWVAASEGPATFTELGVSAVPDATNRLSVSAPAVLLNHAGAGMQLKVNKAAAGDTASLLFQTGFSGRAEMGTAGSDDFAVKVSADGATFRDGFKVAAASGLVTAMNGFALNPAAGDPGSPGDGALWYNSTAGRFRGQAGGAAADLVMTSAAQELTNKTIDLGSNTITGTLAAAQEPAHTGDVTNSAGSLALAIANDAVTNAKAADMASSRLKGRATAGTGDPEDLTGTQATALLDVVTSGANGLAPASGGGTANYLRADGSWAVPPGTADVSAYGVLTAGYTLSNSTSTQKLFNWSPNGALTLATGFYMFDATIYVTAMDATSGNARLNVLGNGLATLANILSHVVGVNNSSPTGALAQSGTFSLAAATGSAVATAGTGTALAVSFRGMFNCTVAGTIIPSIQLANAAAAAVVNAGSFFRCLRLGPTGSNTQGAWS